MSRDEAQKVDPVMSTSAARTTISGRRVFHGILYGAALIGAQRYTLPSIYALACIPPAIFAILYFKSDPIQSRTAAFVAIFLSVDLGAEVYSSTPSFIRWPIYAIGILALVQHTSYRNNRIAIWIAGVCVALVMTAINFELFEATTFINSVLVAFLFGVVFCSSNGATVNKRLNLELLCSVTLVYLACETLNYVFFYVQADAQYMSYASNKAFVTFPTYYFLSKRKIFRALICAIATLIVLTAYGTRMIALVFALLLAAYVFAHLIKTRARSFLLPVSVLLILYSIWAPSTEFLQSNRVSASFERILSEGVSMDQIRILDPVRYDENTLFFNQDLFSILFGSGYGSGLRDDLNLMTSVTYDQAAFSRDELDSNKYYGLHDVWTDMGLRFGLIFVVFVLASFAVNVISSNSDQTLLALFALTLALCSFYSPGGLIGLSIIAISLCGVRADSRQATPSR